MKKKLLRVGVLTIGVLTLALVNWAVASKPSEQSGAAYSNPDGDLTCSSTCTDVETGPTVKATGPITISSPTTVTVQLTCTPETAVAPGPSGDCRGQIEIFMGGVMDSKNYVHLVPNTPTTITLKLTKAGKAQAAAAFANGPGMTKSTCPVKAINMKDNDNGPKTTISHAPDFVTT